MVSRDLSLFCRNFFETDRPPLSSAQNFYAAVPGAAPYSGGGGYYTFPCSSVPSVSFTFPGGTTAWTIPQSMFNLGRVSSTSSQCVGSIVGQDVGLNGWILGDRRVFSSLQDAESLSFLNANALSFRFSGSCRRSTPPLTSETTASDSRNWLKQRTSRESIERFAYLPCLPLLFVLPPPTPGYPSHLPLPSLGPAPCFFPSDLFCYLPKCLLFSITKGIIERHQSSTSNESHLLIQSGCCRCASFAKKPSHVRG